ncbi:MAG: hypothetical protein ACOZQL_06575 [Myxococcota bacterium]
MSAIITRSETRPQRWWVWGAMLLGALGGCRCQDTVKRLEPARVVVSPEALLLPATYVGQTTRATVEVSNQGEATADVTVSTQPPFATATASLRLTRGAAEVVEVTFAPTAVGHFTGALTVGELQVALEGDGLEVPVCDAPDVCHDARFDLTARQCLDSSKPDGTACASRCVTGTCLSGACTGTFKRCDDGDACTVDACSETLDCTHEPKVCPQPTARCRAPTCDSMTGCGEVVAEDGTLCGPDDCLATVVDVCIAGQCVQRPRPDTGRCTNRWTPESLPPRTYHAMAFDAARGQTVLFGGQVASNEAGDTWVWDGTSWTQRTPADAPSPRALHAMAYDSLRQRVVLFGGTGANLPFGDTWEWDGTTWLARAPAVAPSARTRAAMAYDAARRRVVLFGGANLTDTWEWDGTTWTQRFPATTPPPLQYGGMAFDAARQRVVLVGAPTSDYLLSETWEWDGTTWTQQHPTTTPPAFAPFFDASRQRVVVLTGDQLWEWDGTSWTSRPLTGPVPTALGPMVYDTARRRAVVLPERDADTWEWDGVTWRAATQTTNPPLRDWHAMTFDPVRRRAVTFGGTRSNTGVADTWEWSAGSWQQAQPPVAPSARIGHAMGFDPVRQRVLLFAGNNSADTWTWDGTTWERLQPSMAPPARSRSALARLGQQLLVFGGLSTGGPLGDTWAWDGTTWTQRFPANAPSARSRAALAFDEPRQRVVLFGGQDANQSYLADTWEYDGTEWTQRQPAVSPPGNARLAMAYDTSRQRTVLLDGTGGLPTTWEYDGTNWVQRLVVTSPPRSVPNAMAYDTARQRVVFFDGATLWTLLP